MPKTRRSAVTFRVAETGENNAPLIVMEQLGGDNLSMFANKAVIGFHLLPRTSINEAQELAKFLRERLKEVSETKFWEE